MSAKRQYLIKKDLKLVPFQRFNSARVSHKINAKVNSISELNSVDSFNKERTRPKSKLLITNILSVSKHLIINGNKPESSKNNFYKIRHEYPYKPGLFSNFDNNKKNKSLIFSNKTNFLTRNMKQKNISPESSISTFKSSSYYSSKKYNTRNLVFTNYKINDFSLNKGSKLNFKQKFTKVTKLTKKTFLLEKENNYNNTDIILNDNYNTNITEDIFLNYIDNINIDKNYILKRKYDLFEYFSDENNNSHLINIKNNISYYHLKQLIDNYNYNENGEENENYFLTDYYSAKKTSLNIKDSNIIYRL